MLRQGSIIRALVADPQGRNPKVRPLVVVTPTNEISTSGSLIAVAITGAFADPLGPDEVLLPFHPSGHAHTGLRKACVAKCSWLVALSVSDIVEQKGFISTEVLTEVLSRVGLLT